MPARHPRAVPRMWLMTDERLGDALWPALETLPRGGGVIFRDYAAPPDERRARYARVRTIARRRRLVLVVAGPPLGGSDGTHNRRPRHGLYTRAAHDRRELIAAVRDGADAVLVSPVFDTRSHPGKRPLGPVRFGLLIRGARIPVIALGGMDAARFTRLERLGAYGWAAIDAWTRPQKRKAVPT